MPMVRKPSVRLSGIFLRSASGLAAHVSGNHVHGNVSVQLDWAPRCHVCHVPGRFLRVDAKGVFNGVFVPFGSQLAVAVDVFPVR